MTIKTISGIYAEGYTLTAAYAGLVVTSSGLIENTLGVAGAPALAMPKGGALTNSGQVEGWYDDNGSGVGGVGVSLSTIGTVTNFGTITGGRAAAGGLGGDGLVMAGCSVTNYGLITGGAQVNAGPAFRGGAAIVLYTYRAGPDGNLTNLGTVTAGAGGIAVLYGIAVTNGSASDTSALIEGEISLLGAYTLTNFGTVSGEIGSVKSITNGSPTDIGAAIEGVGLQMSSPEGGTITNFGTIAGEILGSVGAVTLTNGSSSDRKALIGDAFLGDSGTITNFATITGAADAGMVLNGSASDTSAYIGRLQGVGTVINFGRIAGIEMEGGGSPFVLVEEAVGHLGSAGGGNNGLSGTLLLAPDAGAGTISRIGTDGGGRIAGFENIEVEAGAGWHFAGVNTIAHGATLSNFAAIIDDGTMVNQGVISLAALFQMATGSELNNPTPTASQPTGSIFLTGDDSIQPAAGATGTSMFNGGLIEKSGGAGTSNIGVSLTDRGMIVVQSGTLAFNGALNSFSGPISGAGAIVFGAGTSSLRPGVSLGVPSIGMVHAGAKLVQAGGDLEFAGTFNQGTQTTLEIGANTFTLSGVASLAGTVTGAGALVLSGADTLKGATFRAVNVDITGASVTVSGVITDYGSVVVDGAVIGSGSFNIAGGTTDFAGAISNNVAFSAGSRGALELGKSQAYNGRVTGLSGTGANSLELDDITYLGGKTKAVYSGSVTSGVLTVTYGTNTAKIHLVGDYLGATFNLNRDQLGGTTVTVATDATPSRVVAAMAGFAPAPAGGQPASHLEGCPSLFHLATPTG